MAYPAITADQVFVEIPAGLSLSLSQSPEKRVCLRAFDVAGSKHRKAHAIVHVADIGDFRLVTVFLAKVCRGEAEYYKAVFSVLLIQQLQVAELPGETALAGGVHHQNDAAGVAAAEIDVLVLRQCAMFVVQQIAAGGSGRDGYQQHQQQNDSHGSLPWIGISVSQSASRRSEVPSGGECWRSVGTSLRRPGRLRQHGEVMFSQESVVRASRSSANGQVRRLLWRLQGALVLLLASLISAAVAALVPYQISQVDPTDIRVDSNQSQDRVDGRVQVVLSVPFDQLRDLLMDRSALCDVAVLHFNIKSCVHLDTPEQAMVRVFGGRKHYQSPDQSGAFDMIYKRARDADGEAAVHLYGDQGPLGTQDYLIRFYATRLDDERSEVLVAFSVRYSHATHWAQRMYFSSLGRNRIGFTVTGHDAQGQPEYVRGLRAMVERNAMRLFLALQVSLESPEQESTDSRLRRWFALTEQYPLQLREMELDDYLNAKRREIRNQRFLQRSLQGSEHEDS
jgi:hypothetical protein